MRTIKTYHCLYFFMLAFICQGQEQITSFEGVNVIPMDTDTLLTNQRVVVSKGRILRIEASVEKPSIAIDTTIIY